jgi:peptidoglycan/xylan/chitin deacetylase (PgdA/CDA1 family)
MLKFPSLACAIAFTALILSTALADAADCADKTALGTSRVMTVDAKTFPRVGLKSFPQTLPLADKEVVLTFDDGPFPPTTKKILATLAQQCVQATFFLIGKSAEANPAIVKEIAAAGHSIGNHTWSHRNLSQIAQAKADDEIDHGARAIEAALGKSAPAVRFFRFPGFASTPGLLASLQSRDIAVFGADLWASDWNRMTPQQQLGLIEGRLEADRKGIILFHDTKTQTAAMLPAFLDYLHKNGYRVVHLVPAPKAATTATAR